MSKESTTMSSHTMPSSACRLVGWRVALCALVLAIGCWVAPAALAQTYAPAWTATLTTHPTDFVAGSTPAGINTQPLGVGPAYDLVATNTGGAATSGAVTITDTLPAGETLDPSWPVQATDFTGADVPCSTSGQTVTCTEDAAVQPGQFLEVTIPVDVASAAPPSLSDQATIAGGGADSLISSTTTTVTPPIAPFVAPTASPSGAAHVFAGTYGSSGSGAGQVSSPQDVTVDEASGDIYVADADNDRIDEFSPTGAFVAAWGWGVADGQARFETCTTSCQAGIPGSGAGQFEDPQFIAVDNSGGASEGDVYVGDASDDLVTKLTASGGLVSSWGDQTPADGQLSGASASGGPFTSIAGITIDASGDLDVYDASAHNWFEFSQDGSPIETVTVGRGTDDTGIGVDSDGNLYKVVGDGNVEQYSSSGTDVGDVSDDQTGSEISGFAIDPSTNDIYADDQGGAANGDSLIRHYDGSSLASCVPAGSCAAADTFGSGELSGSAAGVAYDPVSDAVYVADPGDEDIAVFTPPMSGAPSIDANGETAAQTSPTSETLKAAINPNSNATTYQFEYGTVNCATTPSSCTSVPIPAAGIGSGSGPVAVSQVLTGLSASTTYDYRVVATSSAGTVNGPDLTFTTMQSFAFLPGSAGLSSSISNADGTPDTQAGSTPYELNVGLNFPTFMSGDVLEASGQLRDLTVNLPQGVIVNPDATATRCTEQELESDQNGPGSGCPVSSQIGTVKIQTPIAIDDEDPLYNMVPPAGVPAEFGFDAIGDAVYVHLMGSVRTGSDYGLSATSNDILARGANPIFGIEATLWGDPADASHDAVRGQCAETGPDADYCPTGSTADPDPNTTPLLTMPSACSGPLTTTASADSWQDIGSFVSDSAPTTDQNGNPVGVSGCDQLDFTPSISVVPDTSVADSPSGLDVDLSVPQNESVDGLAEANLKDTTVTLPAGMSVSPSAANGLVGCSEAQIGLNDASEPACPDSSKIGSVSVSTPLLPDVMTGGVYVAQQGNAGAAQGSNPFGSLLAIYVTAEADGALIKLAGHVVANPQTGQLTATFDNNPELPFSDFKLDFFGGPQGVLTSPQACGTYSSSASLSPWSGTSAVSLSGGSFSISSGCVSGFSPSFTAGSENAQAGAYSPFSVSFSRQDTDQFFSGLTARLPLGELAKLSGVGECSDAELAAAAASSGTAEQASPSCPASSQVGTVQASAGPGPDPFSLPGKVYLTGPYKTAPYGLAVVVPAVAGPYDLGTVVVRQQLQINSATAQVTDVSDPFPTILQGIPLQIKSVSVDMNRPDFTVNPTSCDPMSVTALLSSTLGTLSGSSSRFQVGGCAALAFSPKLKLALSGKGQTRSGDHPTLTATLTQKSGQANIASTQVALPLSMALDPNNSQHVCSYSVAQAVTTGPVDCPKSTLIGHATAITPLLSEPLNGPVYLVQGIRYSHGNRIRTLPTLLITLRGQIALDLRAKTSVNGKEQLVTTFPSIPDAAVSKFTLTINGGKKGILVVTGRGRSICNQSRIANTTLTAQSGKTKNPNITITMPCKKTSKTRRQGASHGR